MSNLNMNKISINNIIIALLFVTPHTLFSILPSNYSSLYSAMLYSFALLFFLAKSKYLHFKYITEISFAFCFCFFALLNLMLKGSSALFNVVAPLFALFGYLYLRRNKKMNIGILKYVLIGFYIYFYFVYYSKLPDYLFRPGFDEDAIVFDNSSSNAISMTLVLLVYIYLILNKYYKSDHIRAIFYFSIINLMLVFIQQSRAALVVAVVLFFMSFYEYDKKNALRFLLLVLLSTAISFAYYFENILTIFQLFFIEYNLLQFSKDVRFDAQTYFLSNLSLSNFLIGYPDSTVFARDSTSEMFYTFNVFLDVWNRYGLIPFFLLIAVLVKRFYHHKRYYFPVYYFIPFLVYSVVESIFFPNYWDCFIYLLMFTPLYSNKINAH